MYYIYHIPGVKIGCTKNPNNRIKQQTKGKYEILETHTNINIASERERELQIQYGYQIDSCDYITSVKKLNSIAPSKAGKVSATKSWQTNRERELQKCFKGGKAVAEKYGKPVIMCDMNSNHIKEFKNRAEAAKFVNGNKAPLVQVINKPNNSYKGYKWISPL